MNESVFELVEKSCETLKLDFSSAEFAALAEEHDFSEAAVAAIGWSLIACGRRRSRPRSIRF